MDVAVQFQAGLLIGEWRLQTADSRIADRRLAIWIDDCRFGLTIADLELLIAIVDWRLDR
jgi:hypothetical protein